MKFNTAMIQLYRLNDYVTFSVVVASYLMDKSHICESCYPKREYWYDLESLHI